MSEQSANTRAQRETVISQNSKWKTEWKPNVWHNIAYEIVSPPFSTSTSTSTSTPTPTNSPTPDTPLPPIQPKHTTIKKAQPN